MVRKVEVLFFFKIFYTILIEFRIKNVRQGKVTGKYGEFSKVKRWKQKDFHLIEHIFIILSSFIFPSFLLFFHVFSVFPHIFLPCYIKHEWSDVSPFGRLQGWEARSYQVASALSYSQNWTVFRTTELQQRDLGRSLWDEVISSVFQITVQSFKHSWKFKDGFV